MGVPGYQRSNRDLDGAPREGASDVLGGNRQLYRPSQVGGADAARGSYPPVRSAKAINSITLALMPLPSALKALVGTAGKCFNESIDCSRAHSRTVMYRFSHAMIGT